LPTEATVAQVLVSKYADHLPLYRRADIDMAAADGKIFVDLYMLQAGINITSVQDA